MVAQSCDRTGMCLVGRWLMVVCEVEADSSIDLIVYLQGIEPGTGIVEFRITTNDVYYEAEGIEIEIK